MSAWARALLSDRSALAGRYFPQAGSVNKGMGMHMLWGELAGGGGGQAMIVIAVAARAWWGEWGSRVASGVAGAPPPLLPLPFPKLRSCCSAEAALRAATWQFREGKGEEGRDVKS